MYYRRVFLALVLIIILALLALPLIQDHVEAQQNAPVTPASVTFQVNPAHTGNLDDPALKPPLKQLWAVNLGAGRVSYPLVVGNLVFVTVAHDESMGPYGSQLIALNAA